MSLFPAEADTGRAARPSSDSTCPTPGSSTPSSTRCGSTESEGLAGRAPTPAPLADTLPSMLREDPFARQFCTGLDEVLAPVWLSLDSFAAYLDLGTAPEDMLPWLAHWLGVSVDPASGCRKPAGTPAGWRATARSSAALGPGSPWPCAPRSGVEVTGHRDRRGVVVGVGRRQPARRGHTARRGGRPPAGRPRARSRSPRRGDQVRAAGPRALPRTGRQLIGGWYHAARLGAPSVSAVTPIECCALMTGRRDMRETANGRLPAGEVRRGEVASRGGRTAMVICSECGEQNPAGTEFCRLLPRFPRLGRRRIGRPAAAETWRRPQPQRARSGARTARAGPTPTTRPGAELRDPDDAADHRCRPGVSAGERRRPRHPLRS